MTTFRWTGMALATAALCACNRAHAANDSGQTEAQPTLDGSSLVLPPTNPNATMLSVEPVGGAGRDSSVVGGKLVWNEDRTVRIFTPIAGRVTSILVDAGARVKPDQTLAEIAAPDFGQALADARRATADWNLASRTLARQRDLLAHGVVAQKDIEIAEADSIRAASEKRRADARVTVYGGDTAGATEGFALRAPIGGLIVERNLSPGQEVRPDQMLANAPQLMAPLFVVTDPSRLWVQLDVPERDLPRLTPGAAIVVRILAWPGRQFSGRLTLVGSEIDATSRTVKARGVVDNPTEELKAEMLVAVAVAAPPAKDLEVQSRAVFLEGADRFVFVQEAPNRYRHASVTVGTERNGKVPVLSGLAPGDRVVVDGSLLLNQLYHSLRPATAKSSPS